MEIIQDWDASSWMGERPYAQWLSNPLPELQSICPPSLDRLDEILPCRQAYIAQSIDRSACVSSLLECHQKRNAPSSTLHAIEQLRQPNTYLIIAGQQPGLMGGPLFTLYKILHALVLAKRLSHDNPGTFLPAFWNASEDHDFPEIATLKWLSKEKEIQSYTWTRTNTGHTPYFKMPASECPVPDLLKRITETTIQTEFSEGVIESIKACTEQAESYPDFFDQLIWKMVPEEGLIIIRPDNREHRWQSRSILENEIRNPLRNTKRLDHASQLIQAQGFSPQIHKRPDRTSFFYIDNDQRLPVYDKETGFQIGEDQKYSQTDLLHILQDHPEKFSPSAVLRPVIQDALYPTAAVILGPSELAYHFLLQGVYEDHQVPRPCIVPRAGFTLVDRQERKRMNQYGLKPADLAENPAALLKRLSRDEMDPQMIQTRKQADMQLVQLFDSWKHLAHDIDPTLPHVLAKNLSKIQKDIERSEALLVRRIGEKNQLLKKHLHGLHNSLLPGEILQERQFSFVPYWMKFGPGLIRDLIHANELFLDSSHDFLLIP